MERLEYYEAPMGRGYLQRRDNTKFVDGNNYDGGYEIGDDMEGNRV